MIVSPQRWLRNCRVLIGPVLATWFAMPLSASAVDADGERRLSFYHTHTGERLDVVYYREGHYAEEALAQINHFLRDFRTGDAASVDPATLDIVYTVRQRAGFEGEVHIVSAYRSEKTNEMLRAQGSGVAKKSQHLLGKAIDFRLPGIDTARLRDIALSLKQGGVGYYRESDFIHVDSGRVRRW